MVSHLLDDALDLLCYLLTRLLDIIHEMLPPVLDVTFDVLARGSWFCFFIDAGHRAEGWK
jgi:hypothetical protein